MLLKARKEQKFDLDEAAQFLHCMLTMLISLDFLGRTRHFWSEEGWGIVARHQTSPVWKPAKTQTHDKTSCPQQGHMVKFQSVKMCGACSSDPIQFPVRQADADHDETMDPSSVRGLFSCELSESSDVHLMETFTGKIHVAGVVTFHILARTARPFK